MTITTRHKLIVALIIVVAIIGVLIQTAITKASTYYITVNELYAQGTSAIGQQSSVSGEIIGSSVVWNPSSSTLKFAVRDSNGTKTLPVVFHGDKPDSFSNDWPIIVFGSLNQNGTFTANKLLVKCPSKYNASNERTYSSKS